MSIFFTADSHHGHINILKYTNRPFKNIEKMTEHIVRNANAQSTSTDTILHIGDFSCYGSDRKIKNPRIHPKYYEAKYHAQIVHILGNHDFRNKVKHGLESAQMYFGKLRIHIQHVPPPRDECPDPTNCDVILCGHVHQNWLSKWWNDVLCINVGVDVWNFNLVTKNDIIGLYAKEAKKHFKD